MLDDFFGDVTPQGVVVLLLLGWFAGRGMHDWVDETVAFVRDWYAGRHDDNRDDTEQPPPA